MSHFIEAAREKLRKEEQKGFFTKQLFTVAIDLLQERGVPYRQGLFKYSSILHTINFAEPPITVTVLAGTNLDKAKSVWIAVEGMDYWLGTFKEGKGKGERFTSEKRRLRLSDNRVSGSGMDAEFEEISNHLEVLNLVQREVSQTQE
ncbi:hypothetical protein HY382_01585 [Candidatus Curtissbacteria bacterium]|nr:hypothetical protein [Candidatus Curtissbacteria bacterium]